MSVSWTQLVPPRSSRITTQSEKVPGVSGVHLLVRSSTRLIVAKTEGFPPVFGGLSFLPEVTKNE